MQQPKASRRVVGREAGSEAGAPGQLAEALATLRTAVDDAAVAVGEAQQQNASTGGEAGAKEEMRVAATARQSEKVLDDVGNESGSGSRSGKGKRERQQRGLGDHAAAAAAAASAAAPITIAPGDSFSDSSSSDGSTAGEGRGRDSSGADGRTGTAFSENQRECGRHRVGDGGGAVAPIGGGGGDSAASSSAPAPTVCVTWHPASGHLFYAQGGSLFAEDLGTCRRCALPDGRVSGDCGGGGGGGRGKDEVIVVVSAGGGCVARGSRQQPGRGNAGVTVWSLGGSQGQLGGLGYGSAGGAESTWRCEPPVFDRRGGGGDDGVVALAFSPSGSELCSVGEWDGTKCLLKVRPSSTSSSGDDSLKTSGVVVPLAAKTWAVCALFELPPASSADSSTSKSFLFVTGGEEGVALWRRAAGDGRERPEANGRGGGVRLLGSSAGVRATALARAGRFVVAADLSGGSQDVTAIDTNWLAAGGCQGEGIKKTA